MLPRGTDRCRCTVCGEYFGSTYAFDMHREGPYVPITKISQRRCRTRAEMAFKGMFLKPSGHWVSGRMPDSRKLRTQGAAINADQHTDRGGDL
jgi:hypothetical protein